MIWEPFLLALVLGLIVSAGLYFAYLWPSVEPLEEEAATAEETPAEAATAEPATAEPATAEPAPTAPATAEAAPIAPSTSADPAPEEVTAT